MCEFKCNKNCPHCEWYEPGGYFYESDCEGYRDEGCNIEQDPETCTKYEPTYVQSLLDEIEELKAELENFKKVDEEKLNKLAEDSWDNLRKFASAPHVAEAWNNYIHGFKAGYRRAKEENQ